MLLESAYPADRVNVDLVIADPQNTADLTWASNSPLRIACCKTARQALQWASSKPLLWIIHAQLPDLSGLELHSQLSTLGRQATSILVTERYDAGLELAALSQKGLLYRPKPLDFEQLGRMCASLAGRYCNQQQREKWALLPARS